MTEKSSFSCSLYEERRTVYGDVSSSPTVVVNFPRSNVDPRIQVDLCNIGALILAC